MKMHFLILLVMMGAVNLVVCNPNAPYPSFCVPPTGMIVTTNTSTEEYLGILPIERCCPACEECDHLGGHCKLKWLAEIYPEWCDFTTNKECRDYSCTCCIKCVDDKCSDCTETGGNCRTECIYNELEDYDNKCSYGGCRCCKKCEATDECTNALGNCVTNPSHCPTGSFASTGCCGGCYCCKPILEGTPGGFMQPDGCHVEGAYCSETDECVEGYYPCFGECRKAEWVAGILHYVPGYCCMPKGANRMMTADRFIEHMIGYEAHGYGRSQDQF